MTAQEEGSGMATGPESEVPAGGERGWGSSSQGDSTNRLRAEDQTGPGDGLTSKGETELGAGLRLGDRSVWGDGSMGGSVSATHDEPRPITPSAKSARNSTEDEAMMAR